MNVWEKLLGRCAVASSVCPLALIVSNFQLWKSVFLLVRNLKINLFSTAP